MPTIVGVRSVLVYMPALAVTSAVDRYTESTVYSRTRAVCSYPHRIDNQLQYTRRVTRLESVHAEFLLFPLWHR
ncbi:hypothetical protein GGR52DRAFT_532153 [Hypoxylon sp. FL1284]|nr:hypothetical protein GGR52DRAFT_532153 [Hypoxylon sp. FL1284]